VDPRPVSIVGIVLPPVVIATVPADVLEKKKPEMLGLVTVRVDVDTKVKVVPAVSRVIPELIESVPE
jgi:hypothetical protein